MAHLERILKRRRDADETELDDLRRVVMARLAATNGDAADNLPASDRRPVIVRRIDGGSPGGAPPPVVRAEPTGPLPWLLVAPLEDPSADVEASGPGTEPLMFDAGLPAPPEVDELYEALAAEQALDAARFDDPIAPEALAIAADPRAEDPDAAEPEARPQPRQAHRPGRAAGKAQRRGDSGGETPRVTALDPVLVEPPACCPYCAVLLEQLPETDDRCPRCGQRMIVRSVGARVAILAEAVLPIFEAERHNEERWARDRDRWFELARESGARGDRAPDLAGELISERDVAAARAWYLASVDRAFGVAARDRRWEEAARIRYEQASLLSPGAGSSDPPSDEVVRLHRDGIAADLQAIGEVARDAEVRGGSCCEACRADDRRVAQIADELQAPTLPHEGCPDGLCRCRWFLTTRDQELIAALLRRQMGADRRTADQPDDPWDDARSAIA